MDKIYQDELPNELKPSPLEKSCFTCGKRHLSYTEVLPPQWSCSGVCFDCEQSDCPCAGCYDHDKWVKDNESH